MVLGWTTPVVWVLPATLVVGWLALWVLRRRMSAWFFALGLFLALLCVPAGMVASHLEEYGAPCTPDNLCTSAYQIIWWFNGFLGLLTLGALVIATAVVVAIGTAIRAHRS